MKHTALTLAAVLTAGGAQALVPEACARTTHISHGGEADHVDLGEGRVMWRDWWSQEGTATHLSVMDCDAGLRLQARTAEENMGAGLPFDRTDQAVEIIERHEAGARVFATLERIAGDLETVARDVQVTELKDETCACAAYYPAMRGEKKAFRLDGL